MVVRKLCLLDDQVLHTAQRLNANGIDINRSVLEFVPNKDILDSLLGHSPSIRLFDAINEKNSLLLIVHEPDDLDYVLVSAKYELALRRQLNLVLSHKIYLIVVI